MSGGLKIKSASGGKKGMTLLELTVSMAIIAIMSAIGITLLSSSKDVIKLKDAQTEVATAIKVAQGYALQGKTQSNTVCGYGIRFASESTYRIFYNSLIGSNTDCNAQNKDDYSCRQWRNESIDIENIMSLPRGVTLPDYANAKLFFDLPHANIYSNNGNAFSGSLEWFFQIGELPKSIIINNRGMIIESD
jgi:prepilin-type N-terminal cleavage/methylation domain-containing protein